MAPSFTGVQVRQFILPVLAAHDPSVFEVHFLYTADARAKEAGVPAAHIRLDRQSCRKNCRRGGPDPAPTRSMSWSTSGATQPEGGSVCWR